LRAFEAAARLGSFSAAATEICVTHSAVSHQIRALEGSIGHKLFARKGPSITLTPEGTFLAEHVRLSLNGLAGAVHALARLESAERLTIAAAPSFAGRWLVPRLGRFRSRHPRLELRIHAATGPADFARDCADVALYFGDRPWPNLHCERFLDDEYFPVCSPTFQAGNWPATPRELVNSALLCSNAEPWTSWLRAAGLDIPEPRGALTFDDDAVMLQAAVDGAGVALARRSVVAEDLRRGALVRLFAIPAPAAAGNYVAWASHLPTSTKVIAFRDWLVAEALCAQDAVGTPGKRSMKSAPELVDARRLARSGEALCRFDPQCLDQAMQVCADRARP
jgi:LysR family glycine cleavage system transcriptional activator